MRKSLTLFTLAIVIAFSMFSATAMADEAPASAGVVNINNAGATELMLLPRVGEKSAQRIIEYRTEHGPFRKVTDLLQVKGFGAKTYERVAPYIAVEGRTTLSTKVKSPRTPRPAKPATSASN